MLRLFRSTITVLLLTALSLGVSPHAQAAGSAHDVVIIMDTTSSMANEINQAKTDARATAQQIISRNPHARVGFVQYKDWQSPMRNRSGHLSAAVSEVPLGRDMDALSAALNSLSIHDPGNTTIPESVYTGIMVALHEQPWRVGAKRQLIIIGDAPADDPEYKTCLTKDDIAAALDPRDLDVRIVRDHGFGYNPHQNVASCTRSVPAGPAVPLNQGREGLSRPQVDVLSPEGDLGDGLNAIVRSTGGKNYGYGDDLTVGLDEVASDINVDVLSASGISSDSSSGSSEITPTQITTWLATILAIATALGGVWDTGLRFLQPFLDI